MLRGHICVDPRRVNGFLKPIAKKPKPMKTAPARRPTQSIGDKRPERPFKGQRSLKSRLFYALWI